MSDTRPGADELRLRAILKTRGVGPDAAPPRAPRQLPPVPQQRPRDWLDDILDSPPATTPQPEGPASPPRPGPQPTNVEKTAPKLKGRGGKGKAKRPRESGPQYAPLTPPGPRQSLLDAYDRIPPRVKWLAYHASAAYLGWTTGLVDWATYVTGWIADTGPVGPQAVFWYATAGATALVYRRTRGWWWPVAWLAAVPATSTVVGVLLYGTPHP
jgi:hypothetical protein